MTGHVAATWSVDAERQAEFVASSGDRNPLHVDPIAARRLPFGRVVVHGVHLMLDTLERIVATSGRTPRRVRCTFRHPAGIDDELTTTIDADDPADVRATVVIDSWTAADVRVELGAPVSPEATAPPPPEGGEPEVHSIDSLTERSGTIPVAADTMATARLFPHLDEMFGVGRVAELVSLTRLVGMHVPGLHSLFSSLDIVIGETVGGTPGELRYEVVRADERFSQVMLSITGPSITGTVTAFVRPAPIEQSIGDVRPEPDEFGGQRWLVIGGSRGLGAVAAELLAVGGADVRATYRDGAADAAALAERLPNVSAHHFDVLDPDVEAVTNDGWQPTHLAYMATPPIFDGVNGVYSDALYERFHEMYVDAFTRLVDRLGPARLTGVLWPSSQAVDHDVAGLAEYAAAKRAGERVCGELATAHRRLRVHAPRLPRLLTDQSTSFVPVEFGDTATVMLHALRGVTG